nr:uncharacterized protein LOC129034592 [Pongo pygmaeus]
MTNRKTTSTCPPPYGRRSYDSRNNETLNPLKFYKSSLCQTQRGAAARCPREEHVDCRCQKSPVRALCSLRSRKTPARRQIFLLLPGLRAYAAGFPTKATAPWGKADAPHRFAPCSSTMPQPPTSHLPAPSARRPARTCPRGRQGARETPGRGKRKEVGVCGREPRPGKGSDSGAHAQSQETGRGVPPAGVTDERRARGAQEPAHALWSRPAHERPRGRRSIFSSDPPGSST